MMNGEKIPEILHGGFIVGHDHVYKGAVSGKPVAQKHRDTASDAARQRYHSNTERTVRRQHVFYQHEIDEIGNRHRDSGEQTAVPLNENCFCGGKRIVQHLGEEQRDIVNKSGHLISLS